MATTFSPLFSASYKSGNNNPIFQNWVFGGETRVINLQQGGSETNSDFAARLQTKLQTELPLFTFVDSVVTPPTVSTFEDGNKEYFVISTFSIVLLGTSIPTDGVMDYKDKNEITFYIPIPPQAIEFNMLCDLKAQADQNTTDIATNTADIATNTANILILENEFNNLLKIPNTYLSKIFIDSLGQA